jgi:hypothetical protein
MAYRVRDLGGIFEVSVWGDTCTRELLEAVFELHRCDPGKTCPDLWTIAGECMVPFVEFHRLAEGIRELCPPGMAGRPSAIVAEDGFQQAQIEMFQCEASILPYEVRVFQSRDAALEWLGRPAEPPHSLAPSLPP